MMLMVMFMINTIFTMILGWERCADNWKIVRNQLAAFALKYSDNRALIYLMWSTAEIEHHLGLHDLEASYRGLLESHGDGAAFAGHHGDGVGVVVVPHHGDGDGLLASAMAEREITQEEIVA